MHGHIHIQIKILIHTQFSCGSSGVCRRRAPSVFQADWGLHRSIRSGNVDKPFYTLLNKTCERSMLPICSCINVIILLEIISNKTLSEKMNLKMLQSCISALFKTLTCFLKVLS